MFQAVPRWTLRWSGRIFRWFDTIIDLPSALSARPKGNPDMTQTALDAFAITRRWPATQPEVIQLYTLGTPNGTKVSIAL